MQGGDVNGSMAVNPEALRALGVRFGELGDRVADESAPGALDRVSTHLPESHTGWVAAESARAVRDALSAARGRVHGLGGAPRAAQPAYDGADDRHDRPVPPAVRRPSVRPDLATVARWSPTDIGAEAQHLTAAAHELEALANALLRDFDALMASWVGPAAEQARERVVDERRAWLTFVREWTEAARALEQGASRIADLRGRVLDRVTTARAEGLYVDARGGVRVGFTSLNVAEWVGKLWSARLHRAAISDGLEAIGGADRQTAMAVAHALGADDLAGLVAAVGTSPATGDRGRGRAPRPSGRGPSTSASAPATSAGGGRRRRGAWGRRRLREV